MPPHLLDQQASVPVSAAVQTDRILVVDDDLQVAAELSLQLRQQNFDVTVVNSGCAGRAVAREQRPDLIILDLRLPDMDGFMLGQELADAPETCGTPLILLSGMTRPDIIRRSRAVGCQYFVRKPYDPSALLILIRHSIAECRQGK